MKDRYGQLIEKGDEIAFGADGTGRMTFATVEDIHDSLAPGRQPMKKLVLIERHEVLIPVQVTTLELAVVGKKASEVKPKSSILEMP